MQSARTGTMSSRGLVTMALAALAGCVVSACHNDECSPDEFECDGNVARFCDLMVSDAHKSSNPYIWFENDCGTGTCTVLGKGKYPPVQCVYDEVEIPPLDSSLAVRWETDQVKFGAESLLIEAAGKQFTSESDALVNVSGDVVTSLEETGTDGTMAQVRHGSLNAYWNENDVLMEVRMTFVHDATTWWCDSIATRDGTAMQDDNFVERAGRFFEAPLGEWASGDVEIPASQDAPVSIQFKGIKARVFE